MDNFENEDINIFINSYKQHIIENPLLNSKIPMWVEYLKTKKHYKENGMEEDYFFKKRFRITEEDLITIHKLMNHRLE
jgi:ribosomal protein S19E (S16A)